MGDVQEVRQKPVHQLDLNNKGFRKCKAISKNNLMGKRGTLLDENKHQGQADQRRSLGTAQHWFMVY